MSGPLVGPSLKLFFKQYQDVPDGGCGVSSRIGRLLLKQAQVGAVATVSQVRYKKKRTTEDSNLRITSSWFDAEVNGK
jgi:hypothetical protein